MKGDFSRWTFAPHKHFSRVLMQQGRVQLDADWNEQAAIHLHFHRILARDIVGPHGGPGDSFRIQPVGPGFQILPGHYYVDGILCELHRPVLYSAQPDLPGAPDQTGDGSYLVYMDVWERHVSYLEDEHDDDPSIREVALGGPDTASRAKVIWQVKTLKLSGRHMRALGIRSVRAGRSDLVVDLDRLHAAWEEFARARWQPANRGRLKAWAGAPRNTGVGEYSGARYSGAENHLYRVEIHTGGGAGEATFKWSRENGSVVFPILSVVGNDVVLEHLHRDHGLGLKAGDWVELTDDDLVLHGAAEPLRQVVGIDLEESRVTLNAPPRQLSADRARHPLLRRWDHRAAPAVSGGPQVDEATGAARVWVEDGSAEGTSAWHLEDGVQIEFCRPDASVFCTGDYWLIPARTATADVEWPGPASDPEHLPPQGVEHHYAPLAILAFQDRRASAEADCRCTFQPLARPVLQQREG